MARKAGQIAARGASTWLVRVYLGRDPQTGTRKYHNQTNHGPFREAQRFLNLKLQQRDNGRVSRAAVISLNQLLDQWLTAVVKAPVRVRTFIDYETLLRLHIRPVLGSRLIGTICQVDLQSLYAQMFERGFGTSWDITPMSVAMPARATLPEDCFDPSGVDEELDGMGRR
jgi:integrase